ncbi:hypothetical protein [Erythrobacter sp. MTPC3]|uniref:hypothetical protein n=1 Tax=Erythrobacter sp. MTPC3 TaxID=3056564 RepID=UPI0036F2ABC1
MTATADKAKRQGVGPRRRQAALVALGELLAAVADVLEGQAILRRRGPIRLRRLISVLLTFVVVVKKDAVRFLAVAIQHLRRSLGSLQLRNLYHPPQGWAAP